MSLITNSKNTIIRQVISIILQLFSVAIIARGLGVESNGLYAVAMLLPMMLAKFLSVGLNASTIYFYNQINVCKKEVYTNSFFIIVCVALIGILVGLILLYSFSNNLFPNVSSTSLVISLSIFPFLLAYSFFLSILQAKELFHAFNYASLLNAILLAISSIILYLTNKFTVEIVLLTTSIAAALSCVCCYFIVYLHGLRFRFRTLKLESIKRLLSYGLKSHLSDLISFINYRADIFILNLLTNPVSVGLYYVAVQIVERLWIVSTAMSTVLFPRLVIVNSDPDLRVRLVCHFYRIVTLLTILAAVFLIFTATYLIDFVFGEDYKESQLILLTLLPGVVLGSGSRILANAISAKGKPQLNAYISLITMITNIILNLILIPLYGYLGAAMATSFAYSLTAFLRLLQYSTMEAEFRLVNIFNFKADIEVLLNKFKAKS